MNIEVSDAFYSWLESTRELFEFPSHEAVLLFYINRYMGNIPMRDSKQMDIPFDTIFSEVAENYSTTVEKLKAKKGIGKGLREAKLIARYVSKKIKGCSTADVANFLGIDHSSVNYSIQAIEQRIKESPELQRSISDIVVSLTNKATGVINEKT